MKFNALAILGATSIVAAASVSSLYCLRSGHCKYLDVDGKSYVNEMLRGSAAFETQTWSEQTDAVRRLDWLAESLRSGDQRMVLASLTCGVRPYLELTTVASSTSVSHQAGVVALISENAGGVHSIRRSNPLATSSSGRQAQEPSLPSGLPKLTDCQPRSDTRANHALTSAEELLLDQGSDLQVLQLSLGPWTFDLEPNAPSSVRRGWNSDITLPRGTDVDVALGEVAAELAKAGAVLAVKTEWLAPIGAPKAHDVKHWTYSASAKPKQAVSRSADSGVHDFSQVQYRISAWSSESGAGRISLGINVPKRF